MFLFPKIALALAFTAHTAHTTLALKSEDGHAIPSPATGPGDYSLYLRYQGKTFFDNFEFFTENDPTNGFVDYVSRDVAEELGLINVTDAGVYIGADHTTVVDSTSRGRRAVRIEGKEYFNDGLFVLTLSHMPSNCGAWPAFWIVGNQSVWPSKGETDIIEGVNLQSQVDSTLHTSDGCDQSNEPTDLFTGTWVTAPSGKPSSNCYVNTPGQSGNAGCGIEGPENSMGDGFNAGGGGTFATEWDPSSHWAMWFWPKGSEPADLLRGQPDPSSWGIPYARFAIGDSCPKSHFEDMNFIINLSFCGDWAGSVFGGCTEKLNSTEGLIIEKHANSLAECEAFVKNNPTYFQDASWLIQSLDVYSKSTAAEATKPRKGSSFFNRNKKGKAHQSSGGGDDL